jgi:hypothetical protein
LARAFGWFEKKTGPVERVQQALVQSCWVLCCPYKVLWGLMGPYGDLWGFTAYGR